MKAFRVRDVGHVEDHIGWHLMDGTAFVRVGGGNRPYVTVSPALLPAGEREGAVTQCDISLVRPGNIELVPSEKDDGSAVVIVPSGAFDFRSQPVVSSRDAAWMFVMRLGDSISAYPKVKNLREAASAAPLRLYYDGEKVVFATA